MPTGSASSSSHPRHADSPTFRLSIVTAKANLESLNNCFFVSLFCFVIKINVEFSNKCERYGDITSSILNWHLESVSMHQAVINDDPGVRAQKQTSILCASTAFWNCTNSTYRAFKHMLANYAIKSQFCYLLSVWPGESYLTSLSLVVLICEVGVITISSARCCFVD